MKSTIQIDKKIKEVLRTYKKSPNESFEQIIINLIFEIERRKRTNKELLIEGYKEMTKESLRMTKEFEKIDEDFDWEWK